MSDVMITILLIFAVIVMIGLLFNDDNWLI